MEGEIREVDARVFDPLLAQATNAPVPPLADWMISSCRRSHQPRSTSSFPSPHRSEGRCTFDLWLAAFGVKRRSGLRSRFSGSTRSRWGRQLRRTNHIGSGTSVRLSKMPFGQRVESIRAPKRRPNIDQRVARLTALRVGELTITGKRTPGASLNEEPESPPQWGRDPQAAPRCIWKLPEAVA